MHSISSSSTLTHEKLFQFRSSAGVVPFSVSFTFCGAAGATLVFVLNTSADTGFESRRAANRLRRAGCSMNIETKRATNAAELMTISTTSSIFSSYSGSSGLSFIMANPSNRVSKSCNDVRNDSQSSTLSSKGAFVFYGGSLRLWL